MNNVNFDEYQNIIRKKIALQTLIITYSLIIINGVIKSIYIWGTPLIETTVLIYIPTVYFITRSIFKNVYLGLKEKNFNGRIVSFGIVAVINIFAVIKSFIFNNITIIKNGILQDCAFTLFLALFFTYLTIIIIIKKYLDSHNNV